MTQINVTFILKGHLMWYPKDRKKIHILSVDENAKIADVLDSLNVPAEQIKLVLRNGQTVDMNDKMDEDDEVEIIPIIAGG
jgi:sulfur carrier protein ThiS